MAPPSGELGGAQFALGELLEMEIVFLGTGTSQGVPMIAHDCPDLDLDNPKNWRTRPSIHVLMGESHIQVDAGQEFRLQCLTNNIRQIDYFILTHGHADHILGMDDLRRFCTIRGSIAIPVYSTSAGLRRVRDIYPYADRKRPQNRYYPAFDLIEMPERLEVEGGEILTTLLPHGEMDVLGLIFMERASGKKAVYYTDCKEVGPRQRELAAGADLVVLDALQPRSHPTHMSIDEAVETARAIGAPQTYFTHMAFLVDHETYNRRLPDGISLAYDGLRVAL